MSLTLGQAIWASVKPIIKIYLIIGSGFILSKANILTADGIKCISSIVLTLLLPCLSFNKIVANIEDQDIKQVGIICLTSALLFGTGLFCAFVVRSFMPVPKKWRGGILAGGMFPNISDLPIAYLQTMDQGLIFTQEEGNKGVANVIIFLVMFMLLIFNLGGFRLIEQDFKYHDEESAERSTIEEATGNCEKETIGSSPEAPPVAHIGGSGPYQPNAGPEHLSSLGSITPQESQAVTVDSNQPQPLQTGRSAAISHRRRRSTASTIRTLEPQDSPTNGISDLVREYSNVDQYGRRRSDTHRSQLTLAGQYSTAERVRSSTLARMVTSDVNVNTQDVNESGKSLPPWLYKLSPTRYVVFFFKNCLRPCSIAVILALIIAFVPWLKALFVTTANTPKLKQAPDAQPALSFLMDYTAYIGAASVPFGLLLLGGTLGRLKIGKLYPGFWKSALTLVLLKLCIMPIFGVLWCDRLVKAGWVTWGDDRMLLFTIAINWALPSMTTQIYFTAAYTPDNAVETVQLDCVSFFLLIQYPIMVVTLPFLVTYFLKVQMKL
ncbi:LAME_0D06942g1_1 [Lachancea meyersii CBS 8951]|uniref:LAME_0D06942g1_1 n=1 Tax=Lachancea meyersii CBS 8951 TaxID=1266667 RepID=A0A1G4J9M2_9SACH|nr:LAME_0D06942g1_1 [Lachancea meyersii CBS 8951]